MDWYYRKWHDALDGVAQITEHHVLVVLTSVVAGERHIVALHVIPRTDDLDGDMDRLFEATVIPADAEPLRSVVLRGAALTEAMKFRAKQLPPQVGSAADPESVDYLDDAVTVVFARREGLSAADLIAERRGITRRTAEGRIVKARKMGYLTSAVGKTAHAELTPWAVAVARERLQNGWVSSEDDPAYEVLRLTEGKE